jgi:hypothetical protein
VAVALVEPCEAGLSLSQEELAAWDERVAGGRREVPAAAAGSWLDRDARPADRDRDLAAVEARAA